MTNRGDFINQQLLLVDGCYAGSKCLKHTKMCTSPFVFFRGSSQMFYADLSINKLRVPEAFAKVPLTTVMGDCHTSNFGFFTEEGSHGERIIFSINDFDDACIGHAYWDVLRFAVSLALAQDHCQGVQSGEYTSKKNYSQKKVVDKAHVALAINGFLDAYSRVLDQCLIRKPTEEHFLDATFEDFLTPSPLSKRYRKATTLVLGGESFLTKSALAKAVDVSQFPLQFADIPEKFTRKGIDKDAINTHLSPYFYEHILDTVQRVNAGTGSVNMERLYLLIGPKDMQQAQQVPLCHVIEVKQQRTAAPIYYFCALHHQNQLNSAHLTVKCQRRMQRRQDYCLDEAVYKNKHWLIRSRYHARVGIEPEHIGLGKVNAQQGGFVFYASACAEELARAHCRGDKRSLSFESSMLSALNANKQELVALALEYAEQVKRDWQWMCEQYT